MNQVVKIVLLCLALLLVALLVVSPIPVAGAETLQEAVPVYVPVTLGATDVTPIDYNEATPYEPHQSCYGADGMSYLDDTLSVRIETFRWYDTDMWVAWVQVADASQLRAAGNARFPSKKEISAMKLSKREKAVLAFDGDYIVYMNTGFSVRNTKVLRERYNDKDAHSYDALLVDSKGDLSIIRQMDGDKIKAWQQDHTLVHAFTIGPALVVDGVKNEDYPVKRISPTHNTQRIGIGQMGPLSYVIVATEGPDDKTSKGLTLSEFADIFVALGAQQAYNLDGGSSTALILNNNRINTGHGSKHREITDIIYFVTAMPEGGAV